MINIQIDEQDITITGHADYAPFGSDVVCAAISTLVYSLTNWLDAHDDIIAEQRVQLNEGNAIIHCVPAESCVGTWDIVRGLITLGFDMVAETFPDYVTVDYI